MENPLKSLPLEGEVPVPDYATLLAPTPGRLPTPFRSPAKESLILRSIQECCKNAAMISWQEVLESAHQFSPERIAQGLDLRTCRVL